MKKLNNLLEEIKILGEGYPQSEVTVEAAVNGKKLERTFKSVDEAKVFVMKKFGRNISWVTNGNKSVGSGMYDCIIERKVREVKFKA